MIYLFFLPALELIFVLVQGNSHILIADDDRDDQMFFAQAVERSFGEKFTVDAVDNGVDLLNRLHDTSLELPEFIVLDLNMPLKDGLTVLEELKAENWPGRLPIFVLSTGNDKDAMVRCRELGCYEYYRKPFQLAQYSIIIRDMVQRTRLITH